MPRIRRILPEWLERIPLSFPTEYLRYSSLPQRKVKQVNRTFLGGRELLVANYSRLCHLSTFQCSLCFDGDPVWNSRGVSVTTTPAAPCRSHLTLFPKELFGGRRRNGRLTVKSRGETQLVLLLFYCCRHSVRMMGCNNYTRVSRIHVK